MSKEIEVGLKECSKCEYHLRCEECVGSNYREEIPKLNERISELEEQLAISEKALELACERIVEVDKNKCKVCYMVGDSCLGYKPMCHKYIEINFKTKAKENKSE